MACTYRMKDADGAWQTISGKPAMMAALAEGRLDHLLPAGMVAAMNGESSSSGARQQDEARRSEMDQPDEEASAASLPVRIPSIPLDIATRAFMGTSHSPERRGQAAAAGFRSEIESLWQRFEPAYRAAAPERQAAFVDRFNEIADRYAALTRDYLASHGQVMSTMIAGPAKFPTERNRKRSEAADNKARQAAEYMEKAPARLQKALSGPVDNSVSAALEAAKAKLAEREKMQAQMKATNAALRKGDDEALRGLGYSDAQIADLKKPDFAGRTGIPGYMLTNNNAEIRRQRERIAELEQREAAAQTQTESDENVAPGVRMVKNAEAGRLQLFFEGKPADAVRDDLKAAGFRWAPSTGAWQRQLTGNAELAAQGVIRKHFRGEAAALAAQNANTQDAAAEEAQRVQAAIEGKGLIEAARFLTQSADKAKAAVASAVLNKLERLQAAGVKLELNIAHRGDMVPAPLHNSRGYTETAFDEKGRDIAVWINGADVAGKVGTDEETLLHELVHAATTGMVFYGKNRPDTLAGQHVRALMAVTDAIAAHISQRFEDADAGKVQLTDFELDMREGANNAFRSDDEVLAWALSSRDAQTYLEGIPYKSGSLWSRFVSAVRVMLGLSPQQDTALSEVLAVAERLMTDDAPEMGRAAFWHKRGMRMVQQQGQGSIVQSRQDSKAGGDEDGATAREPSGITADDLPRIFSARFPKLAGAVEEMLSRGERGGKGGLVVLDTNDEVEIAREFAERTGRSFDDTVQMFESGDGQFINAFYDPASGLTFLIGPNLTADSAPALVMHEAVHGQQRERVNAKALALIDGRAGAATPALRAFLGRVAERMDLVGEADNPAEAASYIVELAVQEGRRGSGFSAADGPMLAWIERNIGKPVADIVRGFVAAVRAWALAHGVPLKSVTVDDLVAYAQAGVRKAAKGRVLTVQGDGAQRSMSKTPETLTVDGVERPTTNSKGQRIAATDEAIRNFWRWFGDSKVVDEQGRPLVVYHGTDSDIRIFDAALLGKNTGARSASKGFFFAGHPRTTYAYMANGVSGIEPSTQLYWGETLGSAVEKIRNGDASPFEHEYEALTRRIGELQSKRRGLLRNKPTDQKEDQELGALLDRREEMQALAMMADNLATQDPDQEASSEELSDYFDSRFGWKTAGANILQTYVSIKNPLVVDDQNTGYREKSYAERIDDAKAGGHDGLIVKNTRDGYKQSDTIFVAFKSVQIKSAIGNSGAFSPATPNIQFSRSGALRAATQAATSALNGLSPSGQAALGTLTADQQTAVERVFGKPKTLAERAEAFAKDWKKNLVQGVFDQFAPIKEITSKGYMLARLAKGGDSTLEALMMYGKVSVDGDGVYKVDFDGQNLKGFASAMAKLDGEHDRFLAWVSGQRAERLAGVGLENLMTPQDIAALKTLADGSTASGKVRRALYAEALRELNAFNDSVLKIAADSGLIDEATRAMYRDTPYVPFYRLSEEEVVQGPSVSKGLVNQSAWKQLKGGTSKLNEDLMGNLLKNWSHLITASANNRAAKEVLDTAARMGAATDMTNDVVAQDINGQPIYRSNTKGLVRYRGEIKRKIPKGQPYVENGQTLISDGTAEISYVGDRYFKVDDPHLMDAVASIGFTTKVWKPMADFKRYLTFGVTVNPTFKIRNLIRDSIQAVGTADLSYNPVKNILMGAKGTEMMSNVRAQMLASGGMLRFGSSEGAYSGHVRRLIEKGVDPQYILDNDSKVKAFWKHKVLPAFEAYQELGDRSENVNRAALYEQLLAKGMSHAEASFWARDMMDFSMHGKWAAIRTLTAVVPFMNARLQGIYKLGRATKADYRRMGATLAAVSLASMALMLAYGDDDDWKKREDWDRDNSWWFKIGDTAFRIPKPFEVGAVGTIAERSLELMISDEMTGKRFGQRMRDLLMQNLSMNPTPQLIKPMIDLYANKDGFSGRDIETQGMEKLRPEDRYTARTSEVARFLGQLGLPNPAQLLMGRVEGLSPVQIDHLIRGYFAWVGTSATNVLDRGIRPLMDRGEHPDMRLRDVFLAGNFMESLPSGSSRYVTQFYEQAKEIEQMYASYRQALKEGDAEKAQEIRADNPEAFAARRRIESAKRAQSLISGQMRAIERNGEMSGEEKRARLDQLEKRRDDVARRALLVPAAPGRD